MFKNPKRIGRWIAIAVAIGLVCSSEALARKPDKPPGGGGGGDAQGYVILHLAPEPASATKRIVPIDVNDHNSVVGYAEDTNNQSYALFWIVDGGTVTGLQLASGIRANGLNTHDQIVGVRWADPVAAVYWDNPLAGAQDLPQLSGHFSSEAERINDDGFAVGWSVEAASGLGHAIAWRITEINGQQRILGPVNLGSLAPTEDAWAEDVAAAEESVDESGNPVLVVRITGTSRNVDGLERALMWEVVSFVDDEGLPQLAVQSGPTELGMLPGGSGSYGDAINKHGDVCGTPGFVKLFGQPLLPLLPPQEIREEGFSYVRDMNDQVQIVGTYYYGFGYSAPLLWLSDGAAVDLNQFTGGTEWASLHTPTGINNPGAIVGYGRRYSSGKKNSPLVEGAYIMIPE